MKKTILALLTAVMCAAFTAPVAEADDGTPVLLAAKSKKKHTKKHPGKHSKAGKHPEKKPAINL
jgi:hypothetical protein